MTSNLAYGALLISGFGFMLIQLLVKQKRMEHIFFAIFCGSMAMVAAQQLSSSSITYQYLFGLGTCATCNAMWLVSRSMFSGESSITSKHILFALAISGLIITNNSFHLAFDLALLSGANFERQEVTFNELINLLSSAVLVLSCWEALNGILKQSKKEFWLRVLFIASFCFGFFLCKIVANAMFTNEELPTVLPWLIFISALQIMIVTQAILWLKQNDSTQQAGSYETNHQQIESKDLVNDKQIINDLSTILNQDQRYLTHNLKMIDLANELDVSEYVISRVIRHHFCAPNFNHYINSLRIEHAKKLLDQSETQEWTILVIAMESGFSSLATFNRVFKKHIGISPSQHRKSL